jgi:hypothetical protein
VGLKTILDGALPIFNYYLAPMGTYKVLPIELYIIIIGCVSLYGLWWFDKKHGGAADARQA